MANAKDRAQQRAEKRVRKEARMAKGPGERNAFQQRKSANRSRSPFTLDPAQQISSSATGFHTMTLRGRVYHWYTVLGEHVPEYELDSPAGLRRLKMRLENAHAAQR